MITRPNYKKLCAAGIAFSGAAVLSLFSSLFVSETGTASLVLNQAIFVLVSAIIVFGFKLDLRETLSLKPIKTKDIIISVVAVLIFMPGSIMISQLVLLLIESLLGSLIIPDILIKQMGPIILLQIALAPAICEEILFRGVIYNGMRENFSPKKAIIFCAILFGLFHMDFQRFISQAILGGMITYAVYKTGSIFPAMIMHFVNNAIPTLITLSSKSETSTALESLGNGTSKMSVIKLLNEQAVALNISKTAFIAAYIAILIIIFICSAGLAAIVISKIGKNKTYSDLNFQNAVSLEDEIDEKLFLKKKAYKFFIPGIMVVAFAYFMTFVLLKSST